MAISLPVNAPPAPMMLSEFRTQVRNGLNETSTLFWVDTEVNWAVNFVKDELWKIIKDAREDFFLYLTGTTPYYSLSIVANTHTYTLPTDLVEVRQIIPDPTATDGTEGYRYTNLDINHPDFIRARLSSTGVSATAGTPTEFYYDLVGSKYDGTLYLHLAPTPQTSHTIFITYIRSLPDMITDSHTCDIPPEHHKIMVPMTISYLMMKDRDQGYEIWKADWKDRLNQVKSTIAKRQTAGGETVISFSVEE